MSQRAAPGEPGEELHADLDDLARVVAGGHGGDRGEIEIDGHQTPSGSESAPKNDEPNMKLLPVLAWNWNAPCANEPDTSLMRACRIWPERFSPGGRGS